MIKSCTDFSDRGNHSCERVDCLTEKQCGYRTLKRHENDARSRKKGRKVKTSVNGKAASQTTRQLSEDNDDTKTSARVEEVTGDVSYRSNSALELPPLENTFSLPRTPLSRRVRGSDVPERRMTSSATFESARTLNSCPLAPRPLSEEQEHLLTCSNYPLRTNVNWGIAQTYIPVSYCRTPPDGDLDQEDGLYEYVHEESAVVPLPRSGNNSSPPPRECLSAGPSEDRW